MKPETFQQYLEAVHFSQHPDFDDMLPDAFDQWVSELDPSKVIEHAEAWGENEKQKLITRITRAIND